jgi:hypothetical protein
LLIAQYSIVPLYLLSVNRCALAVTNVQFAPLHGLPVVPVPLSTTPVSLRNRTLVTSEHSRNAAAAAGFRLRFGGGSLMLNCRCAHRRFKAQANHSVDCSRDAMKARLLSGGGGRVKDTGQFA